jgi:hypothetical protein
MISQPDQSDAKKSQSGKYPTTSSRDSRGKRVESSSSDTSGGKGHQEEK